MARPKRDFPETSHCESLKICGTCARVSFGLTGEEIEFLKRMISRYGIKAARGWCQADIVRACGGGGLDSEKTEALRILRRHRIRCWATSVTGVDVSFVDECCFLWQPRT